MTKLAQGQIWTSADSEEAVIVEFLHGDRVHAYGLLHGRMGTVDFNEGSFSAQFPTLLWSPSEEMSASQVTINRLTEELASASRKIGELETAVETAKVDAKVAEREKVHFYRQWFDEVQDLNPACLESADYALAKELYERVGMRVPNSILRGIDGAGE